MKNTLRATLTLGLIVLSLTWASAADSADFSDIPNFVPPPLDLRKSPDLDFENKFKKVTIVFYVDGSGSMGNHTKKVKAMAERLTRRLRDTNCMQIRLAVVDQGAYEENVASTGYPAGMAFVGSPRYLPIEATGALERFNQRVNTVMFNRSGRNEVSVDHVTATLGSEAMDGQYQADDLVVAIVVTDVAIGYDQITTAEEHLNRIQSALGKTKFIAFGLGQNPDATKFKCDIDAQVCQSLLPNLTGALESSILAAYNHTIPYQTFLRQCEQLMPNGVKADLLKNFVEGSGGKHLDICTPNPGRLVDQMADAVFRAAQCKFLM
ncbi:MAG: hypothetical protein AB7F86_08760 [Bdellovibrionales bacterium]